MTKREFPRDHTGFLSDAERPIGTIATIEDSIRNSKRMTESLTRFEWILDPEEASRIFHDGHKIANDPELLRETAEMIRTKADEAIVLSLELANKSLLEPVEANPINPRGDPIYDPSGFKRAIQIAGWFGFEERESEILDSFELFLVTWGTHAGEDNMFDVRNANIYGINGSPKYMGATKLFLNLSVEHKYLSPKCGEYAIRYLKYQFMLNPVENERMDLCDLANELQQLGVKVDEDKELLEELTRESPKPDGLVS